ncbi:D-Lactate dehydrogenase, cytochrome c-dependent [hydrothermal vent metagenome]|uniref:D-lactate dehydrogenase (cytochrome) n=1 Tax=hydrothermal vent metagenome TaxID=652676 RepID=A0A3B0RL46_9ZZZZ
MTKNLNMAKVATPLKALLGDRFSLSKAVRQHHGEELTHFDICPPDAVAFPVSTDEVSQIVKLCHAHDIPVIPYGAGTALEGHFLAVRGGITLDFTRMNQIIALHQQDMDCVVEAGVTREQLNQDLRDTGLFFPIDPGANATLGGMAATRASGTNAVRYGTMRENVIALKAVMADGTIITTSSRARKSAAGYDLTRLLIGSEGTLGIITEITVRLYGVPEAISAAVCPFNSLDGAVDTVVDVIQMGLPIARIELIDDLLVDIINRFSDLDYPCEPTLFMEFHGSETSVKEQAEMAEEIAQAYGGHGFQWATRPEDRSKLWQARHDGFLSLRAAYPGKDFWVTDVCVPISQLAECIRQTRADIQKAKMVAPLVGHVGDGNFHLTIPYDKESSQEVTAIEQLNDRLVKRALAMGGTSTGEHGIGLGKKKYMMQEHGSALDYMKMVKRALDPTNILNPGKIFDL